jgi:hypothetical protein
LHFGHNFLSFCSLAELVKRKPVKLIGKHFPEVEIELRRKVTEGRISVFKQVAERPDDGSRGCSSHGEQHKTAAVAERRLKHEPDEISGVAPRRKANGRISVG